MTEDQANGRRAWLAADDRWRALSPGDRDVMRVVASPGYRRWREQVRAVGGCSRPVYLVGRTVVVDRASGVVVRSYDSACEPGGRLLVRCGNRRVGACPTCSYLHRGDTYHLVRAGLIGGKGLPPEVAGAPRFFVTLTAPSFGAVHRASADGRRCRPRRAGGVCDHERPVGCSLTHADGDPVVGQPVCPDCYDYCGHVLWHAHAGRLWSRWTDAVRRRLASVGGIPRSRLRHHLVVSFAKAAEYQRRGAIHFHAVLRVDGPGGAGSSPPTWATDEVLEAVVLEAAGAVQVVTVHTPEVGERVIRWGDQVDVRAIRGGLGDGGVSDDAVAAYVAKYVSKGVDGGSDHRITSAAQIPVAPTPHIRALMAACWRMGGIPELAHLRLRAWTHALGFRGHVLTKSRRYSTTYGALRAERAAWTSGGAYRPDAGTEVVSSWRYAGSGYTPAQAEIAAGIAQDIAIARDLRREVRAVFGG